MLPAALRQVDAFLRYEEIERRASPHTLEAYARELRALVSFCDAPKALTSSQGARRDTRPPGKAPLRRWKDLQESDVRDFAAQSYKDGLSARSVQRRLSAVRSFMTFLGGEGAIRFNAAEGVQGPKFTNKHLPGALTKEQMTQLLNVQDSDPLAVRDRAIMELFYSSGLRLAELVSLELRCVDLKDRTVRVLGKGSNTRLAPVGSYAVKALQAWLPIRKKLAPAGECVLFVGRNGRRLTPRAVQQRIAFWAREQLPGVHVHPHMFRHACATHMLESGGDLRGVQELLGHAAIATTAIYTHLDARHLTETYRKAHPRARRKGDQPT